MLQKKLCLSRVRILGRKSIPNKALRQTYQKFCINSKRPPHASKKSSNFVLIQNAPPPCFKKSSVSVEKESSVGRSPNKAIRQINFVFLQNAPLMLQKKLWVVSLCIYSKRPPHASKRAVCFSTVRLGGLYVLTLRWWPFKCTIMYLFKTPPSC